MLLAQPLACGAHRIEHRRSCAARGLSALVAPCDLDLLDGDVTITHDEDVACRICAKGFVEQDTEDRVELGFWDLPLVREAKAPHALAGVPLQAGVRQRIRRLRASVEVAPQRCRTCPLTARARPLSARHAAYVAGVVGERCFREVEATEVMAEVQEYELAPSLMRVDCGCRTPLQTPLIVVDRDAYAVARDDVSCTVQYLGVKEITVQSKK